MKQEEILEYNKKCAEFLGETKQPYEFSQFGRINTKGDWVDTFFDNQLKFHSDWNWIMEVVETIKQEIGIKSVDECTEEEWYITTNFTRLPITSSKEAVVQTINQFLIWHK